MSAPSHNDPLWKSSMNQMGKTLLNALVYTCGIALSAAIQRTAASQFLNNGTQLAIVWGYAAFMLMLTTIIQMLLLDRESVQEWYLHHKYWIRIISAAILFGLIYILFINQYTSVKTNITFISGNMSDDV
jgi:heme/copper-type cytochrome/quinol oxidase subunit 4